MHVHVRFFEKCVANLISHVLFHTCANFPINSMVLEKVMTNRYNLIVSSQRERVEAKGAKLPNFFLDNFGSENLAFSYHGVGS